MEILEWHSLKKHNRMLVLRHFTKNLQKIRTAGRQDNTVSGEHPALRTEDDVSERVMPPQVLDHCGEILLVIVPPQHKLFGCHCSAMSCRQIPRSKHKKLRRSQHSYSDSYTFLNSVNTRKVILFKDQ